MRRLLILDIPWLPPPRPAKGSYGLWCFQESFAIFKEQKIQRQLRSIMDPTGIEPVTSCLQSRRSPS